MDDSKENVRSRTMIQTNSVSGSDEEEETYNIQELDVHAQTSEKFVSKPLEAFQS